MKKQIIKYLAKELKGFEIEKRIERSNNEAQTRDNLIHPFLNILRYNGLDDLTHEYNTTGGRKVDISINLGKPSPQIFVECKRTNENLKKHINQLNEYCNTKDHSSVKLSILTNGVIYNFYTENENESKWNHLNPFFSFDLLNYDNTDLEKLVDFMKDQIELKSIITEANDFYFTEKFEESLFEIIRSKDSSFIELIKREMGNKQRGTKIKEKIENLVNSYSIKNVYDKLVILDSKNSNTGIITTDDEIQFFNIVSTLIASSSKIKNNEIERITFRDYKNCFNLLIDDNRRKWICLIEEKQKYFKLIINTNGKQEDFQLETIDITSLMKYKNKLVESTFHNLNL